MSRTIGGPLTAHIATRTRTMCTLLRLDLQDGTSIGITDHERDLPFDLGDGSISYSASTGIFPSDVTLAAGLDADNYEVSGPIADLITRPAVLGGRLNRARARLFMVNWASLGSGAIRLMAGNVSEANVEGGKFRFQIRSDFDRYNQTIGRVITPYCDADYADLRCGLTAVPLDATVTAVVDEFNFAVGFTGTFADDYFNYGKVAFQTGALAGTIPIEIYDWVSGGAGSGTLVLFVPGATLPEIGDTLQVFRGCPKTRTACRDLFSNIANFRGFPEVPGSDQVLKYQVPGDAGA